MPFKDKKKQAESVQAYKDRTNFMAPYMREYRKFKTGQQKELREAIKRGDLNLNMAKEIMSKKPHINLFSKTWQDLSGQKKRKKQ
jgi:hypothetical protein